MKFKLLYKDKEYIVEDELVKPVLDDDNGFILIGEIPYIWSEGNYSCDCNRSLFIQRCCDENFPDFHCGDEIELKEIVSYD